MELVALNLLGGSTLGGREFELQDVSACGIAARTAHGGGWVKCKGRGAARA